ncbi:MAG: hypothetical protein M3R38_08885 [Actinomycetota bacterium]|nr:hypothetical protein [Actinomycetota bacterium]
MDEALERRCVADTSLLNNFVHSGNAYLLERLLGGPVCLSPTVLDAHETVMPNFSGEGVVSEFLKPLYMSRLPGHSSYRDVAPLIQAFALAAGNLWQPVELTGDESALAERLGSKRIHAEVRAACPNACRRITELGPGEAEVAAVAVSRRWTMLTEDRAAADLLRRLHPEIPVRKTCCLLVHAVERGLMPCQEAAELYNRRIVDELCSWAFRNSNGARERRWLRCHPARCSWEAYSIRK